MSSASPLPAVQRGREGKTYRIGIDTGGTFTDIVAIDEDGRSLSTKTPSTPDDPSRALLEGIGKVLQGRKEKVVGVFHGTTVATNALLEERFSSVGLITTKGFRHVLEIARQSVPSGYGNSYFWVKPERIVPLHLVREVTERLNYRGEELVPFDEDEARAVARWFREQGVRSLAVCFLHAYARGDHERRMREIIAEEYPEATVSISSEVLPEYREYERTVTTVVDAFVKPSVTEYVEQAEHKVASLSNDPLNLPFLIMQSNGGVLSAREVARQPISTLLSGPAAGALGASFLAGMAGFENVLTVDAGGTSTDICVVEGGVPHVTTEGKVGRFPVKVPMIDIHTIGTGGGSIAWIDGSGSLRVGPKSAGASPGPMCYGNGGVEPTLTDANVFLGRLPPYLLGGEVPLDMERARVGLERLARSLDLDVVRLAAGIVEIADWNQVNAIRQVTVRKGLDPREYAMVPFGGSGPLQAGRVAQLLGIGTTIIPPSPGNVSAFGLLAVDLKTDYVLTVVQREDRFAIELLNDSYRALQAEADRQLGREGVAKERRRLIRTADIRYFGQAYEVRIDMPADDLNAASLAEAIQRFHLAHERLYGYGYRGSQLIEIVNLRVTGVGLMNKPAMAEMDVRGGAATPIGTRPVHFEDGFLECPIYGRDTLEPGSQIGGPAIVEEYGSTTAIQPGQQGRIDRYGNLILEPGP
ncbi:MAG: hydantoinase/oxoprolinase family protein [Chloroflexota bacterium]|nr:hydantoinase/oxoprolinase family protein [Chloroflexota bacterium]